MLRPSHPESNSCLHFCERASPVTQLLASTSAGFSIWMTRLRRTALSFISAPRIVLHPLLQTLQAGLSNDGETCQPLHDNEESLSVVTAGQQSILGIRTCTMPHTSEPDIRSQFSPTATTTPAMYVPMVPGTPCALSTSNGSLSCQGHFSRNFTVLVGKLSPRKSTNRP